MKDIATQDMIGKLFRVTGRRGDAKRYHGLVGILCHVGEFEGRGNRRGSAITQRVGLRLERAGAPVICVAWSQVSEVEPGYLADRAFNRAEAAQ